ncbi:MAG: hypothetical protein AAFX95_25035, partial [Cyanobacteria bacterium J06639_16]
KNEIRAFVSQCTERHIPVIPLLLPGVEEMPDDFLFLKELNFVNFKAIDDENALNRLAKGIMQGKLSLQNFPKELVSNISGSSADQSLENLKRAKTLKEFTVQEIIGSINNFEKYLGTLQDQKKIIEVNLKNLNDRISAIESQLAEEQSQKLVKTLRWLKNNQVRLAKSVKQGLVEHHPNLEEELEKVLKQKEFDWTLEKFIGIVEYSLRTENLDLFDFYERLQISKEYSNYYIQGIELLRSRISRQDIPIEFLDNINRALDKLTEFLSDCQTLGSQ